MFLYPTGPLLFKHPTLLPHEVFGSTMGLASSFTVPHSPTDILPSFLHHFYPTLWMGTNTSSDRGISLQNYMSSEARPSFEELYQNTSSTGQGTTECHSTSPSLDNKSMLLKYRQHDSFLQKISSFRTGVEMSPHGGARLPLFSCQRCAYSSDRKNNLKRHVIAMHRKTECILECCGITFDNKVSSLLDIKLLESIIK